MTNRRHADLVDMFRLIKFWNWGQIVWPYFFPAEDKLHRATRLRLGEVKQHVDSRGVTKLKAEFTCVFCYTLNVLAFDANVDVSSEARL